MVNIDAGEEAIVEAAATGSARGVGIGCIGSGGSDVTESLVSVEMGVRSGVTRGVGWRGSLASDAPNKLPDGGCSAGGKDVRVMSEEAAKKFGIPEEDSLFCGVGGLRDMTGTTGWGAGEAGVARKADLDSSGVRENGRAAIGGSLVGSGGAKSAEVF